MKTLLSKSRRLVTLANGGYAQSQDIIMGLVLFLPGFLVVLALCIYPIIYVFITSFQRRDIFSGSGVWIGIENFTNILSADLFWTCLKNDVVYTVFSVAIQTVLGMVVALLLHQNFFGRNFYRGFVLLSYVVPMTVAALIWRFMLSNSVGIIYHYVEYLKLPIPNTWFASPETAMPSVISITVWKFFPFMVINFLARLQTIDEQLFEAAKVDGANALKAFYYITLPQLMPVVVIVLLLRTIWTFNNWDTITLLTGGGPLDATRTLPLLVYDTMFNQFSVGRAAATAALMMILLAIAMGMYLRAYMKAEERLR